MKRFIPILLCVFFAHYAVAQTQYGYVRTIGRPNSPSKAIDSVLIKIKDRPRVKSHSKGRFSVELPGYEEGQGYKLENVFRAGYELKNNRDLKEYAFSSSVPLTIDMYSVKDKNNEQREIYNRIYAELSSRFENRYEELLDELEKSQSDKTRIKNELADLQKRFDDNKCLIENVASRYATIDYDRMTSFEKNLNDCIELGDISGAVSLINNEGGINAIVEDARQSQQEAEMAKELAKKTITVSNRKVEKAISSLYVMYVDALSNLDYSKATSYMTQIADLDTCNFDNQIQTAVYTSMLGNYNDSKEYCNRALSIANRTGIREQFVKAYDMFGDIYLATKDFNAAVIHYEAAIEKYPFFERAENDDDVRFYDAVPIDTDWESKADVEYNDGNNYCLTYSDSLLISLLFQKLSMIEITRGHMDIANEYQEHFLLYQPVELGQCGYALLQEVIIISNTMLQVGQWRKCYDILSPFIPIVEKFHSDNPAERFFFMLIYKALSQAEANIITERPKSKEHIDKVLKELHNLPYCVVNNETRTQIFVTASMVYQANYEYEKAFEFLDSAKVAYKNSFKQDTLTMCQLLNNTGQLYWRNKNWDKAIELFQDALATGFDADNDKSPIVSMLLYNIGQNLKEKNLLDSALVYHLKALKIREKMAEDGDVGVYTLSESYRGIAKLYYMKKEYIRAADYYEKAYKINRDIYKANDKEVYGMKRNEFLVLYYALNNEIENVAVKERFNIFMQNNAFALISANDSTETEPYYLLSVDEWNITNDDDAIELYNKCKDKNRIIVAKDEQILLGQDFNLVDYIIGIVAIDKDDKVKLLKLYNKNKKKIAKSKNAKD